MLIYFINKALMNRDEKLKLLGLEYQSNKLSDEVLDIIYEKYIAMKDSIIDINSYNIEEEINFKIKKIVIIKILNEILELSNLQKIAKLEDFIEIDKDVIMNENTKQILNDMDNDISKYFEKSKIGYYRKTAPAYQLNIIRGLLSSIGYKIDRIPKTKMINGEKLHEIKYSISKNNI